MIPLTKTKFFFRGFSILVVLNIHTGRIFLAMNIHIFKFAVWMLVEWEVGRQKVILPRNLTLMLKIVSRDA